MPPLRIAIAGLGTVGSATLRLLKENADVVAARAGKPVTVTAVSAKDKAKCRKSDLEGIRLVDDPRELAALKDIDVVVELIGGAEGIAREVCEKALQNGKHVVTANKALLATHGLALAQLAEKNGKRLIFEAAVAGGIPIVKTMREGLAGNKVRAIQGILNGTCNYILTRMFEAKLDFSSALKEAQDKGYAEADPSMDIDGFDTAHKLTLLAALAFGTMPDLASVSVGGLRRLMPIDLQFAAELDCRIKLLGVARLTEQGLEQRVGPCLVPLASPLAKIDDVLNAVLVQGDAVGELTLSGRGAGGGPTSSAVVADIIDLARAGNGLPFGVPAEQLRPLPVAPAEARVSGWYIRLQVTDKPGVVADVSAILRDEKISIESMLQHGRSRTDSVSVIITTHAIGEAAMRRAIQKIAKLDSVQEEPCWLRIENT
jgi:homoserine dehydrogenase